MSCAFCENQLDSSGHLFFECNFCKTVWRECAKHAGFNDLSNTWYNLIEDLTEKFRRKSIENEVGKLVLAATVYHLWKERNSRLFRKDFHEEKEIIRNILEDVRLKLLSLNPSYYGTNKVVVRRWHLMKITSVGNYNDD